MKTKKKRTKVKDTAKKVDIDRSGEINMFRKVEKRQPISSPQILVTDVMKAMQNLLHSLIIQLSATNRITC